jgi:hypothetical protein
MKSEIPEYDISKSEYDFTEKHLGLADPEDHRGKNWKYIMSEGRINEEDLENGLDNKIWDFRHLIKNFDPLDIKVGDTVITPTEGENIIDKIVKYGWDYNYGDIINFQFGNKSLSNKDLIQRNNRRK